MKTKIFFAAFAAIAVAFAIGNITMRLKERKYAPVEQYIEEAMITVTAPPMAKSEKSEKAAKDELKDKLTSIAFYGSSYRKADYKVIYAQYKGEVKLENGIQSVINMFKDDGFVYESSENEINGNKGAYIEGTFKRKGVKYGIKEQLIKKKNAFWQVLTVYPYSKKNNAFADKFIKSVSLGDAKVK